MTTTLLDLGRTTTKGTRWPTARHDQPGQPPGSAVALSVHGPLGVLDLLVPAGASTWDVAREYAERSGLGTVPLLFTRTGAALPPDLVAGRRRHRDRDRPGGDDGRPAPASPGPAPPRGVRTIASRVRSRVGWFAVAAAAAVLAGWLTGPTGTADLRTPVVLVLLGAALVGVLPVGRFARLRAVTAPAFAGAAAYALLWDPDPLHLPTIVGGAALAAAVTAAVARALAAGPDEGLVVWIVAGSVVFVVPALAALVGGSPALVWSVLLLTGDAGQPLRADAGRRRARPPPRRRRAARRLGVVGARDAARPAGPHGGLTRRRRRGGRSRRPYDDGCLRRHRRASPSSSRPSCSSPLPTRSTGSVRSAWCSSSARRCCWWPAAIGTWRRARSCGSPGCSAGRCWPGSCWPDRLPTDSSLVAAVAGGLAVLVLAAAIATGRGWRSAWWSRRAEVAESVAGAAAIASIVVTSGLFLALWELTSANGPGG